MKHISNTQINRMSQQSVRISTAMIGVLWSRLSIPGVQFKRKQWKP